MLINSLLSGLELKEELIDLPEFGEGAQLLIREMGSHRANGYYEKVKESPSNEICAVYLVIACAVNEKGEQLHKYDEAEKLIELLKIPTMNKILAACNRVNGFTSESDSKKKDE